MLDLSENNFEDTIGKYFFKLIAETNLRSLNLSNNRIRNQTMESIQAAMVHNKQFCELQVANQKFTADDLLCTSNIINDNDGIRFLNLSGNIAVDKINNFFFFEQNPRVESLSIAKIIFNQ